MAVNRKGETVVDLMEAFDEQEVMTALRREKLRLLNIQTVREKVAPVKKPRLADSLDRGQVLLARLRLFIDSQVQAFTRVNTRTICLFTQQLSILLASGVTITSSLRSIHTGETDRKFKKILNTMIESMEGGSTASQSFSRHPEVFNSAYSGLISVGESSGKLDIVLARQARDMEKLYGFKNKLVSSLTYPAVIMICAALAVFVLMIYFVPSFTAMYTETKMKLPLLTQILVTMVRYFTSPMCWLIAAGVVLGLSYLLKNYLATPVGRHNFDHLKIRLPVIGEIVACNELYTIFLNLSSMLECGVLITEALRILRDMTPNMVFREFIDETIKGLRSGSTFYELLRDRDIIPRYLADLVQTGESTGDLPEMIRKAAEMMEEKVNNRLETFLSLIEPFIITILALVVGLIMVAIFLPLYNILNSFSG